MVPTKSPLPTRDRDTVKEIVILLLMAVGLGLSLTGILGFMLNTPEVSTFASETARLVYGFGFSIPGVTILVLAAIKWTQLNGRNRESGHADE